MIVVASITTIAKGIEVGWIKTATSTTDVEAFDTGRHPTVRSRSFRNTNSAMIRHDDVEKELGTVCEMRMAAGVCYLINLAKQAPGEIHLFEISGLRRKISVVVAISAEAQADLERRIS
jgi:hypothetical protein